MRRSVRHRFMIHIYIPNRFTRFHRDTFCLMSLDSVVIKMKKINLIPQRYLFIHANRKHARYIQAAWFVSCWNSENLLKEICQPCRIRFGEMVKYRKKMGNKLITSFHFKLEHSCSKDFSFCFWTGDDKSQFSSSLECFLGSRWRKLIFAFLKSSAFMSIALLLGLIGDNRLCVFRLFEEN